MSRFFRGSLSPPGKIVSALLGLVVVGLVASSVYIYVQPPQGSRFTDFYILSTDGQAGGYQTMLPSGQTGRVVLVVANFEQAPASYRVEVNEFGRQTLTFDQLRLQSGEEWRQEIDYTPLVTDTDRQVEFLLYKDGGPSVYRRLQLTVVSL